jgi:hypothetical protein
VISGPSDKDPRTVTGSPLIVFNAIVTESSHTIVLDPDNIEDFNRLRITYSVYTCIVTGLDLEASKKRRQIIRR